MRCKLKQPTRPPIPTIEEAVRSITVQSNANTSMLPQQPLVGYEPGFGWGFHSRCNDAAPLPSNIEHAYPVNVLPERYFVR